MAVVMAPPDSGPHISGVSPSYHVDQSISATCSTTNSFPATNILWYINSQNIIIKHHQNIINKNQLFDTKSNIDIYDLRSYCKVYFRSYKSLNDKENPFQEGKVKLKCVAMLGEVFLRTNEVSLEINGCKPIIREKDLANNFANYFAISDQPAQSSRVDEFSHQKNINNIPRSGLQQTLSSLSILSVVAVSKSVLI